MRVVKLAELILDYNIYPRTQVDNSHVRYMHIAVDGGAKLPPPIVDKKSLRVVDGFHRVTMYKRIDKNGEIEIIEKSYKNDAEMFADSMRMNAHHGRNLSPFDRTHCIIRAEELGMTVEMIAAELSMTVEAVGELKRDHIGNMRIDGQKTSIPIKRTILHMCGKQLNKRQSEANDKLGGMNQIFYVNQIIELIEADLIDTSNENLLERMRHLMNLMKNIKLLAA
jgi:hypothetical protein